ncbi:MAG: diacylglycerol kinase family lipid kinase [Duncaniella sp.]|nr:diacylglycerol kinase family lipid kinase [Duncaniella sp.]
MKALLIINPISGTSSKEGLDKYVTDTLTPLGWEIDVAFTQGHNEATRLAREAVAAGYQAVLAAGGDGTVNEVAAALRDTDTSLGIIPCGSGNGLARHAGIPVGMREGVEVIKEKNIVPADYMTVNGLPCFCTFGVGFDAAVSAAFARHKRRGKFTYLKSTFETYRNYKSELYTIEVNGEIISERAFLVAVCNASQYGNNAYIAPHASITDGLLDVTVIHSGNTLTTALVGVDLLTGMLEKNALIDTLRTPELKITRTNPGAVHIDGEPMELGNEIIIKCHPGKLKLFLPTKQQDFTPFITPLSALLSDLRVMINKIVNPLN